MRRAGNHTSLRGAVADRSAAPDRLHRDRAAWIRWSLLGVLGPPVKIAAYQAPLLGSGSMDAIGLIRDRIAWCESAGVEILCCPEGVVGGLADYAPAPAAIAIDVAGGQLTSVLAPLASGIVATIVGFTEIDRAGRLYNAAAVLHKGIVLGVYRKLHPAINRSVYEAGTDRPVFTIRGLTFGIVICRDSTFSEPARVMAARGAAVLFVPTNNGLPRTKANPTIVADARNSDIARATETGMFVVRADVAGHTPDLVAYGSSGIVDPDGVVLGTAPPLEAGLVVAEIPLHRGMKVPTIA